MKKIDLCPEEMAKAYTKYFDLPMDGPHPLARQLINAGPIDPKDALPVSQMSQIVKKGHFDVEFGYCMLPDGSGYIAHYEYLPNLTMEMLGWWFEWFNLGPQGVPSGHGNLRYKIWCPADHWNHGFVNGKDGAQGKFLHESLDMGAGDPPLYSVKTDIDPLEAGIAQDTADKLASEGVGFGFTLEKSRDVTSRVCCSMMRPHPLGGVEVRGRFWWGWSFENGKPVRDTVLSKKQCTENILKNNLIHTSAEIWHLTKLLPLIWPEYKDKPLWED